jgi:hypothetical protein
MKEELGDILQNAVFSPWEKNCKCEEEPWKAMESLRLEWQKMILSGDFCTALAGGIGLARVSGQTEHEHELTENYFNSLTDPKELSLDTIAMILLTGASPPHIFLQSFLTTSLLSESGWGDSFYWSLLSSYVRHPHSTSLPLENMFDGEGGGRLRYLVKCNPEFSVRRGLGGGGGSWLRALFDFKSDEIDVLEGGKTEIAGIARALRADIDPKILRRMIDSLCLDRIIEDRLKEHPVLQLNRTAGKIFHASPTLNNILFFGGGDDVSRIWRFYNPLLIFPWMMEKAEEAESGLLYLGKLLCGAIPASRYNGDGATVVNKIGNGHPFLLLDLAGSGE